MKRDAIDPTDQKLDAILTVLQDLVIIEGARAGLTRDTVRNILRVDNTRISKTWRHLKAIQKSAV
jgi:hypothetical protein